ncbi:MAG: hypothetical protein IPK13_04590 [Deltaproteobacteria bacterium]|nr:hypothetical protein [Deltaproteobacteria bacterium]
MPAGRGAWTVGLCALLALTAACADEIPGESPPGDQLYYPVGLVAVPGALERADYVAVVSSNFDQRYNAGRVTMLSVDDLFSRVTATSTAGRVSPTFDAQLASSIVSSVRIDQFGGQILYVPSPADPALGTLFVPSRDQNWLTMIDVGGGGQISCGTLDSATARAFMRTDCTAGHVLRTGAADPFSVAAVSAPATPNALVAVGHLTALDGSVSVASIAALADRQRRADEECSGLDAADCLSRLGTPVARLPTGLPGVGGISSIPPPVDVDSFPERPNLGKLIVAGNQADLSSSLDIGLSVLSIWNETEDLSETSVSSLRVSSRRLSVAALTRAIELRGVALRSEAPTTSGPATHYIYMSARFTGLTGTIDSQNGGLLVFRLVESATDYRDDRLDLVAVLQVGEEVSGPFLLDHPSGAHLAYLPDARSDKIWIVDVTREWPIVVGTVEGRAPRTKDGEPYEAHTLDGPASMAFVQRGARVLGLVTNFANSTLAVADLSSAEPRMHQVVVRLGRDVDAEGQAEGPGD